MSSLRHKDPKASGAKKTDTPKKRSAAQQQSNPTGSLEELYY